MVRTSYHQGLALNTTANMSRLGRLGHVCAYAIWPSYSLDRRRSDCLCWWVNLPYQVLDPIILTCFQAKLRQELDRNYQVYQNMRRVRRGLLFFLGEGKGWWGMTQLTCYLGLGTETLRCTKGWGEANRRKCGGLDVRWPGQILAAISLHFRLCDLYSDFKDYSEMTLPKRL